MPIHHHPLVRSIVVASAIEGVLATCSAFAKSGPCGPSTILGGLAIVTHLPALCVLGFLGMLEHASEPVQLVTGFIVQVGFFTLTMRTFAWIASRQRPEMPANR